MIKEYDKADIGPYYHMLAIYDGFDMDLDRSIEKAVGIRYLTGSGFGPDGRDISFGFDNEDDVEKAQKRIKEVCKNIKIETYFYPNGLGLYSTDETEQFICKGSVSNGWRKYNGAH